MKKVLITGANRGLGFEIARQIGRKDFHVFLSGRDGEKLSEAVGRLKSDNIPAEMLIMDVTRAESIRKAAEELSARDVRLDVLINNAGILLKADESLIDDDFEIFTRTIITNSFGPLRVVREFIPIINSPGRIINISSGGGSMSDPVEGWSPAYCTSKTMLNAITRHLAHELRSLDISVNAVCPGWLKTDMGGNSAPRPVEKGAQTPVWLASEAPQNLTGKIFRDKREIPW